VTRLAAIRSAVHSTDDLEAHRGPRHPVRVYLILSNDSDEILLALRSDKVGISPDMWALPCGSLDDGEDMAAAVALGDLHRVGQVLRADEAAARPSASRVQGDAERLLASCVPANDWNSRSIGAPASAPPAGS
jgi:hypothetical protein